MAKKKQEEVTEVADAKTPAAPPPPFPQPIVYHPEKKKELELKDLTGIKVLRAQLRDGIQAPNAGMETTLHTGKSNLKELKMLYTLHGLVIENKGKKAIIPLANVLICFEE